ncbi:hypothetical protein RFI_12145 [Reticulomyxa filosa]|uniref:Uncharacterized protein n=1 Tax=Reticulomyxa filosa TaxID=46433 RepID=X6NGH2_RETFI|nr:hypothetical protein RFI_12145 [Reticulomyxa filosa]|eukprot:ETO24998.1 hypothetical protein RFI_12145 [Reticulomyxa filosa]
MQNNLKVCKYCGKRNHKYENCHQRKDPRFQKCVLCKGKHAINSLCHVIQKTIQLNESYYKYKRKSKVQNYKDIVIQQKKKSQTNYNYTNFCKKKTIQMDLLQTFIIKIKFFHSLHFDACNTNTELTTFQEKSYILPYGNVFFLKMFFLLML